MTSEAVANSWVVKSSIIVPENSMFSPPSFASKRFLLITFPYDGDISVARMWGPAQQNRSDLYNNTLMVQSTLLWTAQLASQISRFRRWYAMSNKTKIRCFNRDQYLSVNLRVIGVSRRYFENGERRREKDTITYTHKQKVTLNALRSSST